MTDIPFHILGIAPYDGMRIAMERASEIYPNVCLDAFTGDLEQGAAIVVQNLHNAYDCIISRGGTAEFIRKVTDIPVVEIHLSVYDVLRGIKLAENYTKRYAIVGFPSITKPAHILCDLLRYPLDIFTIHNTEETYATLTKLKKDGYSMVVGDMITQTAAQHLGMDAFLITSSTETLQSAIEQSLILGAGFRRLRQENVFLRCVTREEKGTLVVLDDSEKLYYAIPSEPPSDLLKILQEKISEIPERNVLRFHYNDKGTLYRVSGQAVTVAQGKYYLFYYLEAKIPLRSDKMGMRSYSHDECEHLFNNSFYAISGAMGAMGATFTSVAVTNQPVMILGETGTGKEQIARYLYLHSSMNMYPIIVIDCELASDKTWDYLLNHYNSPFNDSNITLYFRSLELLSAPRRAELLSIILDTGLQRRQRLIFSCVCQSDNEMPDTALTFIQRLGCMMLRLPTLRSRKEEISSLASLYLGNLNQTTGKQISGFEPNAIEQLRTFNWPNNYTQFRQVLQSLAALTNSAYISSQHVAEILAQEREIAKKTSDRLRGTLNNTALTGKTLEDIIQETIHQTLVSHNGNQTTAAKQLGISRTTMWRYLNKNIDKNH